jgi:glycosyltransferase involved in cell wall biosynthesis
MRIAICLPQVPFAHGGAEILAGSLADELRCRDHDVALVSLPFKWYPGSRVLSQALLWRLVDLEEVDGSAVDLVIATKFPSYVIRHPRKVVWLVHQFRQAYELDGTELGQFDDGVFDRSVRRSIHRLDAVALGEARSLFAISGNVAERLRSSLGLEAEVLHPPPQDLAYRCDEYGDFVLSVGRLDRMKRVDLLLEAAAIGGPRVVIAGEGPDRPRLEAIVRERGLNGRATFLGRVGSDELADLYARCLAVFYAPIDEDLGLVPYEALRSAKPVVTTRDSGGPLEVILEGKSGLVCEPTPAAVRAACAWLADNPDSAEALGRFGRDLAERITWDHVVERLLA